MSRGRYSDLNSRYDIREIVWLLCGSFEILYGNPYEMLRVSKVHISTSKSLDLFNTSKHGSGGFTT